MADFRIKVNYDKLTIGVAGQKVTVLKVGPQGVKGDKGDKGDQGASDWADITNKPATFTPPVASNSTLGGIIVGSNLSITNNGVLSANIPPGGVTAFNGRTGNVTLTANDVTAVANGIYIVDSTIGNIPTSAGARLLYGQYQTRGQAPAYPYVSGSLGIGSQAIVGVVNSTDPCNIEFWPGEIFNVMRFRSYDKTIVLNTDGFSVETGTANWTWSANSILTQGRGDARYQTVGSYLNDVTTNIVASYGSDSLNGVQKGSGSSKFVAGKLSLASYGFVGVVSSNETCGMESSIGGVFGKLRLRHTLHTLLFDGSGISVETGTANWTWSDNSILTQGRADSRYQNAANNTWANLTGKPTTLSGYGITDGLTSATAAATYQTIAGMSSYLTTSSAASTYLPSANFTYANLTGKPTLATVATSGNYNDLSNKPASYTLPAATNSTLGGIIVGANLSVSANGTLSANIPTGGGGGFANGDILNGGTF